VDQDGVARPHGIALDRVRRLPILLVVTLPPRVSGALGRPTACHNASAEADITSSLEVVVH
jgi:hypothetical protein